jgi:hypothetical protein
MGRHHPGDFEKHMWIMINPVLRLSVCNVICRSVASSGGRFKHGDELPDFTKAAKLFASSSVTDCLPAISFQRMNNPRIVDFRQEKGVFLFSKRFRPAL